MTIGSLLQTGVNGMLQSQQNMAREAHDIARHGTTVNRELSSTPAELEVAAEVETAPRRDDTVDLAESMIEMRRQQQIFDASAKTVSVGNEMLGTLLDIQA